MPIKLSSNTLSNSLLHFSLTNQNRFKKAIGEFASLPNLFSNLRCGIVTIPNYVTKQVANLNFLNTDKHFKRFRFRLFHCP